MPVRGRDDAQVLGTLARTMLFPNATVDESLETANAAQAEAVCRIIEIENANRAATKHARLLCKAKFPAMEGFGGYDFANVMFPAGCREADLKALGLIEKRQDFVFFGPTGRGKTRLATAVGLAAVDEGVEVRFFNVAELVVHMAKLSEDGKLGQFMRDLEHASLVILDEFGYVPINVEGRRLPFQVVSQCHERRSVIITTNIEFGHWGTVLGDDKMASALIDRLIYHGRMVEFGGASHRMENALMLGKQGDGK